MTLDKYKELIGKKFGKLTVVDMNARQLYYPNGTKNGLFIEYVCQCECGNLVSVKRCRLLDGKTKSCGCLRKKITAERKTTHGLCHTRLNAIWHKMKSRCYSKTSDKYKHYGARGIKICEDWLKDFKSFYDWSLSNGYKDDLTIDRIDVNGDYCPQNCRWITQTQQTKNTTRTINYKGKCLADWWRFFKIPYSRFYKMAKDNGLEITVEQLLKKGE